VVGEDPGSKSDKAKEIGIKILSEEEFKKMVT
jgi:NAD-dependent DNA ligase